MFESCCSLVERYKKGDHTKRFPNEIHESQLAIQNNHIDCLKYFHENGFNCPVHSHKCAIYFGSLDCLKYLVENKICNNESVPCFDFHYNISINSTYFENRLPCYRYLIEQGFDFTTWYENEFDQMFENQEWYWVKKSMNNYLNEGIIDQYSLHIHHKVKKIQKAWIMYAYSPNTVIGRNRLLQEFQELDQLTSCSV